MLCFGSDDPLNNHLQKKLGQSNIESCHLLVLYSVYGLYSLLFMSDNKSAMILEMHT